MESVEIEVEGAAGILHALDVTYICYPDEDYCHPDTGQTLAVMRGSVEIRTIYKISFRRRRRLSIRKMSAELYDQIQEAVENKL